MENGTVFLIGAGASCGYVPVTRDLTTQLVASVRRDSCSESRTILGVMDFLTTRGFAISSNFEILIESLDILANIEERQSHPDMSEMSAGRSVLSSLVDVTRDIVGIERDSQWSAIRTYVAEQIEDILRHSQTKGGEKGHGCVSFVKAFADRGTIFSLNYDHLIEKGLGSFDSVCHLHGCIAESDTIRNLHGCDDHFATSPSNAEDRGWITGNNKAIDVTLSRRYRTRFFKFQSRVRTASRIVVVGYGFADPHINAVLSERPRNCQVCIVEKCPSSEHIRKLFDTVFSSEAMWPPPMAIQPSLGKTATGWQIDNKKRRSEEIEDDPSAWHHVGDDYWIFIGGIESVATAVLPAGSAGPINRS